LPIAAGLIVLALLGWLVGTALGGLPGVDGGGSRTAAAGTPTAAAPTTVPLVSTRPASEGLYDPEGDGKEARGIDAASDGNPDTTWRTDLYQRNDTFGNLKPGIGITYDFDRATPLREVTVTTDRPGIQVEILAGDSPDKAAPADYTLAGPTQTMKASSTFKLKAGTSARYYIVFITQLVPDGDGFRGSIADVTFSR
jgi:putative peptidoglycan lipid II flippase